MEEAKKEINLEKTKNEQKELNCKELKARHLASIIPGIIAILAGILGFVFYGINTSTAYFFIMVFITFGMLSVGIEAYLRYKGIDNRNIQTHAVENKKTKDAKDSLTNKIMSMDLKKWIKFLMAFFVGALLVLAVAGISTNSNILTALEHLFGEW